MIRLRDMMERGCRHRFFGPVVVLVLVVLLASVFLHVAIEGAEAAGQLGALCLAVATVLGSLLVVRSHGARKTVCAVEAADRGPPTVSSVAVIGSLARSGAPVAIPLRR